MNRTHRATLAAAALLMAALVAPAKAPRAYGGPAAAPRDRRVATALPRFALFGWVSPPAESTTAGRYAEMAGAGFNVAMPVWEDSGLAAVNRLRLAAGAGLGMKLLLVDIELDRVWPRMPSTLALADTIVSRYRDDPAFLGYYLGDEPGPERFARLGEWFDVLRARDPAHPAWNNLFGRARFGSTAEFESYVRRYVAVTRPAVLCADQYDFLESGDRLQFTENIATLAGVAREHGLPFWGIVMLIQYQGYRETTPGMLRWQVAQWLAYGTHGIGYFTYWTPAPDPDMNWQPAMIEWGTGVRTPWYGVVRDLNARLAPLGDTLASMQWLATAHAGSVPPGGTPFVSGALLSGVTGRATLGFFADAAAAPLVFVGNADSLASRAVTLALALGRHAWRLRDDGTAWDALAEDVPGSVTLALEAGDFALLRLSGRVDSLAVGAAPRLDVSPNPARGAVRFSAGGMAAPARLELYDIAGRRVWSHRFGRVSEAVTWSGERDGGGRAPAGACFARLSDAHGATVRRVLWLGTP